MCYIFMLVKWRVRVSLSVMLSIMTVSSIRCTCSVKP